jgi:oxygen-independent coproporphyrinogen-3 oxidase
VHVPFCRHRCGYCNFSVVSNRDEWIERFLAAIDQELASLDRPEVQTIFLGGGTPTHLNESQLERLFEIISKRFVLGGGGEWSIEANPEDVTKTKLDLLVDRGINRISLGIQSFDDQKLRQLERSHQAFQAIKTTELVATRIPNLSIDLIFATPGETLAIWQRDLETALRLPIQHLSTYSLTFEKGTSFWSRRNRGELRSADESDEVEMYQMARRNAAARAFEQYEISNFSKPGYQCAHNRAYWEGEGWYAAGPGAARFVGGVREVNHRSTSTYLQRIETGQSPVAEREPISLEQYARELAAFGIRMLAGFEVAALSRAVGFDVSLLCHKAIELSVSEGLLLIPSEGRLQLSERGILFADTVASRLLG